MYNNLNSSRISYRKLFPPVVPSSIPAFDGTQENGKGKLYKIFFKKSIANFSGGLNNNQGADFGHVQVSVTRLDNNTNAINQKLYPLGLVFAQLSNQTLDSPTLEVQKNTIYRVYEKDPKSPYCLVLEGSGDTFAEPNSLYKVQLRLAERSNPPTTVEDLKQMEVDLKVSEWSSVVMIKPISPPDYGIQGFLTKEELKETVSKVEDRYNIIATANFEYVGYYNNTYLEESQTGYKTYVGTEQITEYSFQLLSGQTRKVLSDSGPKFMIEHERKAIFHTFDWNTKDGENYIIVFNIKTENGYVGVKEYPVLAKYKYIEMSNAMVKVQEQRAFARMRLELKAKQIVFEPIIRGGKLGEIQLIKDEGDPMYGEIPPYEQEKIESTHALIKGSAISSGSFYLTTPTDVWTVEAKVSGIDSYKDRATALDNPYMLIENDVTIDLDNLYFTKVKIICYEQPDKGFGIIPEIDTDYLAKTGLKRYKSKPKTPSYIFEAIKTSYKRVNGIDFELNSQSVKIHSVSKTLPDKYINDEGEEVDPVLESPRGAPNLGFREQLKKIPKDPVPHVRPNPENQKWDVMVDSNGNSLTVADAGGFYVLNPARPIDPNKEIYLYFTNFKGGFNFFVFDEYGYVSKNADMINFNNSKKD